VKGLERRNGATKPPEFTGKMMKRLRA